MRRRPPAEADTILGDRRRLLHLQLRLLAAVRRRHPRAALPDPGAALPRGRARLRLPAPAGAHPGPGDPVRAVHARRQTHLSAARRPGRRELWADLLVDGPGSSTPSSPGFGVTNALARDRPLVPPWRSPSSSPSGRHRPRSSPTTASAVPSRPGHGRGDRPLDRQYEISFSTAGTRPPLADRRRASCSRSGSSPLRVREPPQPIPRRRQRASRRSARARARRADLVDHQPAGQPAVSGSPSIGLRAAPACGVPRCGRWRSRSPTPYSAARGRSRHRGSSPSQVQHHRGIGAGPAVDHLREPVAGPELVGAVLLRRELAGGAAGVSESPWSTPGPAGRPASPGCRAGRTAGAAPSITIARTRTAATAVARPARQPSPAAPVSSASPPAAASRASPREEKVTTRPGVRIASQPGSTS